jgi:UDP-2,4-diacetamido-2,4,6-trideoxy-beta-L-altropyranose hydrolase
MEDRPKIYLRADGDDTIGYGHVIRSLAVADMIRDDFELIFIIQKSHSWLLKKINEVCDNCIVLQIPDRIEKEAEFISSKILSKEDIIVLDGYQFTTTYQLEIKKSNCQIVCIDDLHNYHFLADVVIDHAGGTDAQDYSIEPFTKLAIGPEYSLLRRPFRDSAIKERVVISIESVFICFGGADVYHNAFAIAKICLAIGRIKNIHVVSSDPLFDSLEPKDKKVKLVVHKNLEDFEMAELMGQCQLAICPSSTISYEVCTIGMGFITGIHADNQQYVSKFLASSGCAENIGDFRKPDDGRLQRSILGLNESEVNEQIRNQRAIFKNSEAALRKIFKKLQMESLINIRKAAGNDANVYFIWATDPTVRNNSINKGNFTFEEHIEWFKSKMHSPKTFLYVFELGKTPIGQLRFELENDAYTINYSIDKNYRGQGLSDILIRMGIKKLCAAIKTRPRLFAMVRAGNIASSKAFNYNTFKMTGVKGINGIDFEIYQK